MKALILVLCGASGFLLAGCGGGGVNLNFPGLSQQATDEEQIVKVLNAVHVGMETRKVGKIMTYVSPNYLDQEGRDYEGIRKYLNQIMNNYWEIDINRAAPRIVVEGDRARVLESFGTLGDPGNARTPPVTLQGQVSVYLERTDKGWKIVEWGAIS